MILELFIVLVMIAFTLVFLGFFTKIWAFSIVGFIFLFILSAWIILANYSAFGLTGLQYKTGLNLSDSSQITYIYGTYNDVSSYWIGYLLAILSLLSIFIIYFYAQQGGG